MSVRMKGSQARAWLWPLVRPHRGRVALGTLAVLTQSAAGLAMSYRINNILQNLLISASLH